MANAMLDARQEGDSYRRIEVITGQRQRRRWTAQEKARIVAESFEEGANISEVARRNGVAAMSARVSSAPVPQSSWLAPIDPSRGQWRARRTHPGSGPALRRSANRSMRCFRLAPIHAHQLLVSLLLPTTRKGRGPPKNELHLCHAVAKHHSLNQCVHFLQRGLLGCHFPTKVPHFGPQGLDFIGLTAPQHHRLPPSLTLRSAPCHNNVASLGLGYG